MEQQGISDCRKIAENLHAFGWHPTDPAELEKKFYLKPGQAEEIVKILAELKDK